MPSDIRWAILATVLFTALIHTAAAKDATTHHDPWEQLLAELEAALSAVEMAAG